MPATEELHQCLRMKTLDEIDFAQSPHIPASRIRALAEGGYLEHAEPVLLAAEPGTGKTHLATGLAIAACRQRKAGESCGRVRLACELLH